MSTYIRCLYCRDELVMPPWWRGAPIGGALIEAHHAVCEKYAYAQGRLLAIEVEVFLREQVAS